MPPKLIIFDCDGVLVDSEPTSNQALVDNLAGYGLPLTLEESMRLFVGGSMQGVQVRAKELGAKLPDNWIDEIYSEMYSRLREGVEPIPGVIDALQVITDAGLPVCVASNGSDEKMHITLGSTGLMHYFKDAMFSAHSLGVWKPDPGLFLAAATQFGIAPNECVVIEDSLTGATAASNAGMSCMAYTPEHADERFAEAGATCFRQMQALPRLFGITS